MQTTTPKQQLRKLRYRLHRRPSVVVACDGCCVAATPDSTHRLARDEMSVGHSSIENMFDSMTVTSVDPLADEAALIARIAELERLKAAAAAGQARATAAVG